MPPLCPRTPGSTKRPGCSTRNLACRSGILVVATVVNVMPLRKTAIAIPEKLLFAVDRAAQSRGESRDRFVIRVLQEAVRARRDADAIGRLNELFADGSIAEEQSLGAGELDLAGTDWSDERW